MKKSDQLMIQTLKTVDHIDYNVYIDNSAICIEFDGNVDISTQRDFKIAAAELITNWRRNVKRK